MVTLNGSRANVTSVGSQSFMGVTSFLHILSTEIFTAFVPVLLFKHICIIKYFETESISLLGKGWAGLLTNPI